MGISIAGLSKAAILAALYNRARPGGMGFLHYDPTPMTEEQAQEMIGRGDDSTAMFGVRLHGDRIYFDYLKGRVMKVDLSGDELDTRLFNRDNGEGAAEEVIAELRATGNTNSATSQAEHFANTKESAVDVLRQLDEETTTETSEGIPTVHMGLADVADVLGPAVDEAVRKLKQ